MSSEVKVALDLIRMNGCAAINTEGFISEFEAKPAVWNLTVEQSSGGIYKWNAWQEEIVEFHSLSSKKVTEGKRTVLVC